MTVVRYIAKLAFHSGYTAIMSERRKKYSKNSVIEIFGILWEHTDDKHGLTPEHILEKLQKQHHVDANAQLPDDIEEYVPPSTRTIREQLDWLSTNYILGRRIAKIKPSSGDSIEKQDVGWYMEPYFSPAQMRLLTDSLMLSRINEDTLNDLTDKIRRLAGGRYERKQYSENIASWEHYNTEFIYTIDGLDQAIADDFQVSFAYCDYNITGELTPRTSPDGESLITTLDPYRLIYKQGRYYIIGHVSGTNELSTYLVDRIRNLTVTDAAIEIPLDAWQQDGTLKPPSDSLAHDELHTLRELHGNGLPTDRGGTFDPVRFARQRPQMTMGEAQTITLIVNEEMTNDLYEDFDEPHVIRMLGGTGNYPVRYIVQVKGPEQAMLTWVLRYGGDDRVEVLDPQSLRDALAEAAERIGRRYGDQERVESD